MIAYSREDTVKSVAKGHRTHFSRRVSSTPKQNVRDSNSGSQVVAMMQTAEPWHGYNSAACSRVAFCFTTGRRPFRKFKMCSVVMVVPDVLIHQPFQVPFIENDHVVEQIPAAVADPPLGDTFLPWTT